jgi:hypothetical protein
MHTNVVHLQNGGWGLSPAPAALSEFSTGPQTVFGLLAGKPYSLQAGVCFLTCTFLQYLALVNDGTAVAVNYAMTKTFLMTPEYVTYDANASSRPQR